MASDCDVFKSIENAGLYQNEAFWEDFAKISARGVPDNSKVQALILKYTDRSTEIPTSQTVAAAPSTVHATQIGRQTVELHKHAQKHYSKAAPHIQRKVDQLVELASNQDAGSFVHALKTNNWRYEYIEQVGHYSVRLNDGYRALLNFKDGKVIIYDIGLLPYRH